MASLNLDKAKIKECRELAKKIVNQVFPVVLENSTVGIERAVLRLIGVEGAKHISNQAIPYVNIIVDQLKKENVLNKGALFWFANGLIETNKSVGELAKLICDGEIRLTSLKLHSLQEIKEKANELALKAKQRIINQKLKRFELRKKQTDPMAKENQKHPIKYVIVATGNIFEDVIQARAAVEAGAEAIAVIRSTAQSLLDYVPEGATTEGFGGTYATQENFRIMRQALDEFGDKVGRYIRLTNYCSGLCMSEIATMAAFEGLDFLLNDAMYGILFRDINMKRTLIDQDFSRRIIALAEIVIHTGEDNYLTTADAIENGHQVLASQFINERFAFEAGMREEFLGLGHAAEMNPWHENVILLEIARAQMTREIFPGSPIKFMPPTRHMDGDIFFGHLLDTMFNLVSVLTKQGIHLLGMPTEAIHTPLLMDRWMSLKSTNYVFNAAKNLGDEIIFKQDGIIATFANKVLDDTLIHLRKIAEKGLFKAIEEKAFANVSRTLTGGKGYDGVFKKDSDYLNPFYEVLKE
jgi:beta-lysine 5,6-aminomutase alpha subunit